jgi:hypothetical protein
MPWAMGAALRAVTRLRALAARGEKARAA